MLVRQVDRNGKDWLCTDTSRQRAVHPERKASSNICSNQALFALAVSVYLATMGNEGVRQAAILCWFPSTLFCRGTEKSI